MRRLAREPSTPLAKLTFALVMVSLSILLLADLFGLVPDTSEAYFDARKKFCESLAVQLTHLVNEREYRAVDVTLESVLERNRDVLSLGLRTVDGNLLTQIGKHEATWPLTQSDPSTLTHTQVPLFLGEERWGALEIHFEPLSVDPVFGIANGEVLLLLLFVGVAGLFFYRILLRRSLRYLDPRAVIPDRVRETIDTLAEGVLVLDRAQKILLANKAFVERFGRSASYFIGRMPGELPWEIELDGEDPEALLPWDQSVESGETVSNIKLRIKRNADNTKTYMVNAAPIIDDAGTVRGVMVTFDDVTDIEQKNVELEKMLHDLNESQTEIKRKNQELAVLATQDALTGCVNRRAFLEILDDEFLAVRRDNHTTACMMCDIDHFKAVNDTYGHQAGDLVIKAMANALRSVIREDDTVCRYGGEEFCVLLPDTDSAGAARLAERMRQIVEALDFSNRPELRELRITSSFGVADTSIGVRNPTELIEKADQALYAAKNGGRNQVIEARDMTADGAHSGGESAKAEQTSAQHDVLTGLPDRQMFLDKLRHAVVFPQRPDEYVAVMLLDIDMFKRVNNSMGHSAGDRLLRECGERLSNTLRGRDTIAKLARNEPGIAISRLGGDEFGVLLRGIDEIETIPPLVERIQQAISAPFQMENMDISITSSIGIAVYPRDGERPEELLTNADIAMYSAKRAGPNGYQFYDVSMVAGNADDLQIESELRQALGRDQFVVFYQPQVELNEGRIIGAEALIRWQHPERGLVPPIKFIPMAERFGIINEIGHWVLRQACNQARIWQTELRPIPIAVNLSALQFRQPDLVLQIRTLLEEYRLDAHALELEVTETVLMDDLDEVIPKIQELHDMGIKVSIDDFGVGYSSLAYLKRFAIDTLKIDRAFVQGIESSDDDRAIAEAVILLGRALNLDVIAEGVDKQEQLVKLKELGCNELQGYLFSPPIPAEEFDELLRQDVRLAIPRMPGPKLATTSAA